MDPGQYGIDLAAGQGRQAVWHRFVPRCARDIPRDKTALSPALKGSISTEIDAAGGAGPLVTGITIVLQDMHDLHGITDARCIAASPAKPDRIALHAS